MKINERVRLVRKSLNMNQKTFGERIVASQNYLSSIENGQRDVTEKIIKIICHEFNISEKWLREGEGEMFLQKTISLDEKAKQHNLTQLETDIIKEYMELPASTRKDFLKLFAKVFTNHAEAVSDLIDLTEVRTPEQIAAEEAEKYRIEVLAELKGETSLVSEKRSEKSSS